MKSPNKILIVDDEKAILTIMKNNLKKNGYDVICAPNGKEAYDLVEKELPDLIISDIMMPIMNGYELCSLVKKHKTYKDIYFIILSAKHEIQDIIQGLEGGADEYITKPFEYHELLARVKAGMRIKSLVDSLKSLSKMKDEFLGIAAHDLRNPISIINMITQQVQAEKIENISNEEMETYIEMIDNSTIYMLELINDLLDISKIESGKIELRKTESAFNNFLIYQSSTYELLASKKDISIIKELDDKIENVIFDQDRISQVISNLLSNAIKFTSNGGKIFLRSILTDTHVIVEIEDTGQGIPQDELDFIFQPFKQISIQSTAGEKGTGLGLAIVKKIVMLHKGKLQVESKVGIGTNFAFSIPLE